MRYVWNVSQKSLKFVLERFNATSNNIMTQVMLLDILPEGGLEHEMLQLTVIGCHDN